MQNAPEKILQTPQLAQKNMVSIVVLKILAMQAGLNHDL
jgi:hypothetical protein